MPSPLVLVLVLIAHLYLAPDLARFEVVCVDIHVEVVLELSAFEEGR